MEQDPEKLFPLIQRVNELLAAKEKRLMPTIVPQFEILRIVSLAADSRK